MHAVVYNNRLYLLGGVGSKSEGKTQIATLYRDTTSGQVDVKWTLGPEIPIKTGSAVAAVVKGKASIYEPNACLCITQNANTMFK